MTIDKKKIGVISALILMIAGAFTFLIYRDEKTFNERIVQFKDSVKNFFTKKKES